MNLDEKMKSYIVKKIQKFSQNFQTKHGILVFLKVKTTQKQHKKIARELQESSTIIPSSTWSKELKNHLGGGLGLEDAKKKKKKKSKVDICQCSK